MKRNIFILWAVMLTFSQWSAGQTSADYKVIFDITSSDPVAQRQVVRDAGLIKSAHPDAQIEVVVYGQALPLIQKDKSPLASDIEKLISQKGVSFNACHVSMDRNHVTEADLIKGAGTVPDGIYEIILKQKQGWGYIKISQ
jgi:intracellular sulfur oxidation DsrE/DsrF family protein